jgi:hypothetical protein
MDVVDKEWERIVLVFKSIFWIFVSGLVLIFLVILFFEGGVVPKTIKNLRCGPSTSLSKPMAEAIVDEINKLSLPRKAVKLGVLEHLPFEVVDCEKDFSAKGGSYTQICYFTNDDKRYSIRLKYYGDLIKKGKELFLTKYSDIYIRKDNINEEDLTDVVYNFNTYVSRGNWTDTFILQARDLSLGGGYNWYSKDSIAPCKYRAPFSLS